MNSASGLCLGQITSSLATSRVPPNRPGAGGALGSPGRPKGPKKAPQGRPNKYPKFSIFFEGPLALKMSSRSSQQDAKMDLKTFHYLVCGRIPFFPSFWDAFLIVVLRPQRVISFAGAAFSWGRDFQAQLEKRTGKASQKGSNCAPEACNNTAKNGSKNESEKDDETRKIAPKISPQRGPRDPKRDPWSRGGWAKPIAI